MQKKEAVELINSFATSNLPFLFVIDFLAKNAEVFPLLDCIDSNILFEIEGYKNYEHRLISKNRNEVHFQKFPLSFEIYKQGFENIQKHIWHGNSYLLNYALPTKITTNLSLLDIFYQSKAKYKLYFKDKFICFSPETFIKIRDNRIFTYPMKGTIDASIKDADKVILTNDKEKAEHFTIVDLLRNDLSIIAENVRVERFRYIDKLETNQKTLLQVSSEIVGDLPYDYQKNLGEILFQLLPAGSISGAPKKKTIEIILESEIMTRGFYTGIFGVFDGKNLNSAVMIRFIEQQNEDLIFKSGGGITSQSNIQQEYQEMIDKVYLSI